MFEEMGFEGIVRREENGEVEKRGWRIRAERLKKLLLLLEGKWKGERKRREEVLGMEDRAMVGASVKPGRIFSSPRAGDRDWRAARDYHSNGL